MPVGARLLYCSNGGGGFGPPQQRDPDAVSRDVADGLISDQVAERIYGVVMNSDGELDRAATERMRKDMGAEDGERGLGPDQVHPVGGIVRLSSGG